jgi:hypothetical protein
MDARDDGEVSKLSSWDSRVGKRLLPFSRETRHGSMPSASAPSTLR